MIYQFSCPACGKYDEVIRTVDECKDPHNCTDCGQLSNRVFSAPQVSVPHAATYYDHGLGAIIRNEKDKQNAIKKIEGETGKKLIEVGTEDVHKHVKPPQTNYEIPRGLFDSAITE